MASYTAVKNILDYAVSLSPSGAFPIDARSMFGSYDAALVAAQSAENAGSTNTKYYYGQRVTVFENDVIKHYTITNNNTLEEEGKALIADSKTIAIDGETISMYDFGKKYYTYHAADEIVEGTFANIEDLPTDAKNGSYAKIGDVWYTITDGVWAGASENPHTQEWYSAVTVDETHPWKAGLEPRVAVNANANGFEIAWYEPSTTTVEGVSSALTTVQTTVNNLTQIVGSNYDELVAADAAEKQRAEAAEAALAGRVTANENAITILNGAATVEGSVDYKIAQFMAPLLNNEETMNSMQELVDFINNHPDAAQMNESVLANTAAITAINNLLGTALPDGVQATNVIDYIAEAVAAEKDRAETAEAGLATRITNLETANQALGTAAQKNVEFFATAEQGAKADTAIQSIVASENNGYVSVDQTDVKVYELPKATIDTLGGVMVDGTSITVVDGVISVNAVDASKITGLDTKIATAKQEAIDAAAAHTEEYAVAKANVVDSTTVADSADAASAEKVVSEELLLSALSWKTGM